MVKDAHGHLHDALGRFARTGRKRVQAGEYGDRTGNRAHQMNRAESAFQPPTSAVVRRAQKERIAGEARQVRNQYERLTSGRLTANERENISYQSPTKRAKRRAETGDVVMPRLEALRRNVSLKRDPTSNTPRVGTTRTFTGKPKVVRGYGPEAGVQMTSAAKAMVVRRSDLRDQYSTKKTAAAMMAAKPPTPAPAAASKPLKVTPEMRREFALTPDARLRDMARGLGADVPKRAGTNQLIELILRHRR